MSQDIEGPEGDWDEVGIVEYPCPLAFFAMAAHPEFQARAIHKEAGVERSIVMVTNLAALPESMPDSGPFPAAEEDPGFERIEVIRYRDEALYSADSNEPARTGEAAMELFSGATAQAAANAGISPLARLTVDGVFVGDGRAWDMQPAASADVEIFFRTTTCTFVAAG